MVSCCLFKRQQNYVAIAGYGKVQISPAKAGLVKSSTGSFKDATKVTFDNPLRLRSVIRRGMVAVAKLCVCVYVCLCIVVPAIVDLIGRQKELLESGHINFSGPATEWKAIRPTGVTINAAQNN